MQPTTDQILAWAEAQYERQRKIAAIRYAKKNNKTWSADHPDSIRNQIRQLNEILFAAEAQ